jgi:hypothetical protein
MPTSHEPLQGDHVINDVRTAVLRPFEIIRSLHSADVDGQHFLHDHLVSTYSFLRGAVESHDAARAFVATGGMESTLRALSELRPRFPRAAAVTAAQLRALHDQNSSEFGTAASRFEIAILDTVQDCLEGLVSARRSGTPARFGMAPGIVYQQMFDAAYDPAAALRVVADSRGRESASSRGVIDQWMGRVVDTLDTPPRWREPYQALPTYAKDSGPSAGPERTIHEIGLALLRMESAKTRGLSLTTTLRNELLSNHRTMSPPLERQFGAMLSLIHGRLQQFGHTAV